MNEKIGLQDLVVLLAEKANITKKDAEALVKECFDTMEEGLVEDNLLKIRNLGTFKLVQVEDRESVDVSTGERVLIPAHYKVTFSPDVELAEKVNAPYASLEPVEIAENGFSGKPEDEPEIDDETDDDNEVKIWLKPEEQKEPEIETVENKPEEPEVVIIEQKEPEVVEIEQEKPEIVEIEPEEQRVVYEKPPVNKNTRDEQEEDNYFEQYDEEYRPVGATSGLFWLFFLAVSFVILFFAGHYFCPMINYGAGRQAIPDSVVVFSYSVHKPQISDSLKAKTQKSDSTALQAANVPPTQPSHIPAGKPSKAQAPTPPKTEPVAAPKAQPKSTQPAVNKSVATPKTPAVNNQPAKTFADKKYRVRNGERLNTIALREYGHKAFWVYIYDENRKAIRNPDLIEPGMVINIPPAGKYGIDKHNRESVNKALELERKYKP